MRHGQFGRDVAIAFGVGEATGRRLGHDFHAGDFVGDLGQILQDAERIGALIVLRAEFAQRFGNRAVHELVEKLKPARAIGKAQHRAHGVFLDLGAAAVRHGLIEQGLGVAHRTFGGARD